MIVIKCNQFCDEKTRIKMQQEFVKEAQDGVVVLPAYCKLVGATPDEEVSIEYNEDWDEEEEDE